MRLITAALVRNEANRFLPQALAAWKDFSDEVVVLDDGSTDGTQHVLEAENCTYRVRDGEAAWGKEAFARAELWNLACERTSPGDYIFVLDADMVPLRSPRPLLEAEPDSVAFILYDLWTEDTFRIDGFWQGHLHPRIWLVRRPSDNDWLWLSRGVHCGHFPLNIDLGRTILAPPDYGLLHAAYITPELRLKKAKQYQAVSEQLSDSERRHAWSILDTSPQLARLPYPVDYQLI